MASDGAKQATLYRMVTADHICPFGLKTRDLLKREGFAVDDNWLTTRKETDAFQGQAWREDHASDLHFWRANRRL